MINVYSNPKSNKLLSNVHVVSLAKILPSISVDDLPNAPKYTEHITWMYLFYSICHQLSLSVPSTPNR